MLEKPEKIKKSPNSSNKPKWDRYSAYVWNKQTHLAETGGNGDIQKNSIF